jgi:predicted lipoprotein
MKRLWLILPLVVFLPLAPLTGCKSAPKTAYATAQGTTITVEAAMGLWDKYVTQQHPSTNVEIRVRDAYNKYREADLALLRAGKAMLEAQTAGDAAKQSASLTAWQSAEAALTASANDVYALLKEIGVRLP